MPKHEVGDKVKIREDLVSGELYGCCVFVPEMRKFCGKIVRITAISKRTKCYRIDSNHYFWTDEMFEDVDTEVHGMNKCVIIDVYGNKVVARCGDKEGVARCHSDDTFDFYTGARLALKRLEEAEKPYGWLKEGMVYYIPSVIPATLYESHKYDADMWDERFMKRGIVFKTKEEAIAYAKKMLAIVKKEG